MEGKELEFFQNRRRDFCGFSARPGGLGESAGCCYASFWMLGMKSEKPEITANCVKEQGRKCRLVGKANFFPNVVSLFSPSPRFVKIGGLAQNVNSQNLYFFLSF